MVRNFFFLLLISLMLMPFSVMAKTKVPAIVVVPFTSTIELARATTIDVTIVAQNNTGVNQTITNLSPILPAGNIVTATLIETNCGFLRPGASCEATYTLVSQNNFGNGNLNIAVCTYNGTLCSRIKKPITVQNAPIVSIQVAPTDETIAKNTTQQFTATAQYANKVTQDITKSVTWTSSDLSKAVISNTSGTEGLATGVAAGTAIMTASKDGVSGSTSLTVTAATLTSITVVPVNRTIAKGTTRRYAAIGIFSDNTYQNLTRSVVWSSSNTAVASISNNTGSHGVATGNAAGTASITATLGAVSGSTNLTVTAATLTSISVTPTDPEGAKGTTQQFAATGIYSDNSTSDLTDLVTWSTGSVQVAIVSNRAGTKGMGYAYDLGSTSVTATLGAVSGSTNFTVTPAVLTSISVAPESSSLAAGEEQQYTATGTYSDNTSEDLTSAVTWGSSSTAVAVVSNASATKGLGKGIAAGSASITATLSGIQGSALLTVTPAVLTSIAVTPTTPGIANGTQISFTATGTYSDATTLDITNDVTWVSSSPAIAVISNASGSEGLATGVAAGSTTISALLHGVSGNTVLTVSAAVLTSIAVTPVNTTIPNNTSQQFVATGTYSDASTKVVTDEVTWKSTVTSIAAISNADGSRGLATGVGVGATTIQAISGGVTGSTTLNVANLRIGDNFGGGVVACLAGGTNNFVVATINNSTSLIWGGAGTRTNAQSNNNGAANTTKIVTVLGAGTSYAAGLCDDYEIDSAGNTPCVGGNTCYNDWFLVSINQLSCMRSNRNQIGGFIKAFYWSSTEYSRNPTEDAWTLTFANSGNEAEHEHKSGSKVVRCARLIASS